MSIDYRCGVCKTAGVRLWRDSHTFLDHLVLRCRWCAEKHEMVPCDRTRTDQIGSLFPAVPDVIPPEEAATFWGYTAVPPEGGEWWNSLPCSAPEPEPEPEEAPETEPEPKEPYVSVHSEILASSISCPACGEGVGYQCATEQSPLFETQRLLADFDEDGGHVYRDTKVLSPPGGRVYCRKGVDPARGKWTPNHGCLWRGSGVYRGEDGNVYLHGPLQKDTYGNGDIADFLFPNPLQALAAAFEDD